MDAECAIALVILEPVVEDNGCDPAGRGRHNLWEAVARVARVAEVRAAVRVAVRAAVRAVAKMVAAVRVVGVRGGGDEGGGTSSQILGRTEPWHLKMRLGNE